MPTFRVLSLPRSILLTGLRFLGVKQKNVLYYKVLSLPSPPLPFSSPAPFIRSLTTSFARIKQDINGDWTAEKSGLVYLDFVPRMCVPFLSPSPSSPTQD